MNTNVGIPTTYKGVRMRSRLEARWAAFFDLIGWDWTYEPLDLAGYIPDFGIRFEPGRVIVVEVKPALSLDELALAQRKVEHSGWPREALLVGADLFEPTSTTPLVGLIAERVETPDDQKAFAWGPARLFECLSCGRVSVLAEDGSWACRACGCDGGNSHLGQIIGGLSERWAEASNRVQWRAA
jgi:hypothetical protein